MVLMVFMVLISGPGAAETLSGRRQSLVEQVGDGWSVATRAKRKHFRFSASLLIYFLRSDTPSPYNET